MSSETKVPRNAFNEREEGDKTLGDDDNEEEDEEEVAGDELEGGCVEEEADRDRLVGAT